MVLPVPSPAAPNADAYRLAPHRIKRWVLLKA